MVIDNMHENLNWAIQVISEIERKGPGGTTLVYLPKFVMLGVVSRILHSATVQIQSREGE